MCNFSTLNDLVLRARSHVEFRPTARSLPALPACLRKPQRLLVLERPRPTTTNYARRSPQLPQLPYYLTIMAFLCCCSSFTRSQMPDLSLSLVSLSNTFLIGQILDTDSRKPVYSIDTVESLTSILRHTSPTTAQHRGRARENRTRSHIASPPSQSLVASVQWPERSPHIVPLRPRPGAPRSNTAANPTRDEDGVHVHLDDGSVTPLPRFLRRRSQALYVLLSALLRFQR